jgi:hypothetical protein
MVPAALLNVQHHHAVLDLCAAPGSKTLQVLEGLYSSWRAHAQESSSAPPAATSTPSGSGPSGVVVANDLSAKRAYGLAARAKPVGSPTASLMVLYVYVSGYMRVRMYMYFCMCVYGCGSYIYVCVCVVVTCVYACMCLEVIYICMYMYMCGGLLCICVYVCGRCINVCICVVVTCVYVCMCVVGVYMYVHVWWLLVYMCVCVW